MKTLVVIGMAGWAACAATGMAEATTLPPQREPVTLVNMVPVLPPPAATRSERDYFQAPHANQSGLQDQLSCRLTATLRPNAAGRSVLCE